ncbi:MAG: hypothetical protein ACJAS1_006343 [Oleiphilaceae bacterium]|jgi:hypothetical protein
MNIQSGIFKKIDSNLTALKYKMSRLHHITDKIKSQY